MPLTTVLLNPTAGGQTKLGLVDDVTAAFTKAGAQPKLIALKAGDDVVAIARTASETSDVVVAAGGDGTVNAVASAVAGTATTLGVLPIGTLNHFARDMKLPGDLEAAVATVVAGRAVSVDAGEVNGRLFVNNSSIGVYPNAVAIREALREAGHRKWVAMGIAIWRVLRTYRGVGVALTANGRTTVARTPFVFVGNNEYVIEGMRLGAREHLTGGQLFVYLAPRIRTRQLPMLLVRALLGRAVTSQAFEIIATAALTIHSTDTRHIAVSLDGETTTLRMPLHYQSRPAALKVLA